MSITCSSLLWWWSWMRFTGNDPTDEGWTDDWWSPSTAKLLPSGWTWTQVAVVTILNCLRVFFSRKIMLAGSTTELCWFVLYYADVQ
jgi:hypothetical protein